MALSFATAPFLLLHRRVAFVRPPTECHFFDLARTSRGDYFPFVLALPTRHTFLKKQFQYLLVLLGCLHLVGGPYSMMQVYAWVGMLVTYSQNDGIVQATKDTFSGEKPCGLCCKIAAARKTEHGEKEPMAPLPSTLSAKQLQEMIPAGELRVVVPRSSELPPVVFAGFLYPSGLANASPPTPPPRSVA